MNLRTARLLIAVGLMSAVAASASAQASTDSIEAEGVRFGTGATRGTITEKMRITQSGLVGIGTATPTALLTVAGDISSAGVVQVSGSSLSCSAAIKGAMRYSNTSSTVEYCNSTAWTSLGPSDTTPVSFLVTRGGSNQTVTAASLTKLQFTSEVYDTNNNFDNATNYRFTPTVRGKYLFTLSGYCPNSTASCVVYIMKNGAQAATHISGGNSSGGNQSGAATVILDMNGTTDYVEGYVTNYSGTTIDGAAAYTYFAGSLLGPQAGSSGGGATPAGSTGDIQFNTAGALAADTGQLFWDATNNRLGIGTGSPDTALHVVGDIAYTGVMSDVSDRRMKRDIVPLGDAATEQLMRLKPVTFRMKDADDTEYGFIAQDVQKVFPELVRDGEILSLNYVGLIAPVVKTIQLLKHENDEQRDSIDVLAEQNRLLRSQLKDVMLELRRLRTDVQQAMHH